jgi:hypothetical protein
MTAVRFQVLKAVSMKFRAFWVVASIISAMRLTSLMMETVRISETSVNFNVTTRRYIPEDSELQWPL